jgi:hypothetical protein
MSTHQFSILVRVRPASGGAEWWLSSVHGPSRDEEKPAFLELLSDLKQSRGGLWLLCGDFNMIYLAMDKNNDHMDRRRMGQFRRLLNEASLKEIHLEGRLFTWSNDHAHPTLQKIDMFFVTTEWEVLHPNLELHSFVSLCSDHAPSPLILSLDNGFNAPNWFMFQAFWPKFPGFQDVVTAAWRCPLRDVSPFWDWCPRNTTRVLKSWSARNISRIHLQLEISKELLHRLEIAMDSRPLAQHEEDLHRFVKLKSLALSSLQRTVARQESRLLWLREGDAPMRFFHI